MLHITWRLIIITGLKEWFLSQAGECTLVFLARRAVFNYFWRKYCKDALFYWVSWHPRNEACREQTRSCCYMNACWERYRSLLQNAMPMKTTGKRLRLSVNLACFCMEVPFLPLKSHACICHFRVKNKRHNREIKSNKK